MDELPNPLKYLPGSVYPGGQGPTASGRLEQSARYQAISWRCEELIQGYHPDGSPEATELRALLDRLERLSDAAFYADMLAGRVRHAGDCSRKVPVLVWHHYCRGTSVLEAEMLRFTLEIRGREATIGGEFKQWCQYRVREGDVYLPQCEGRTPAGQWEEAKFDCESALLCLGDYVFDSKRRCK